MSTLIGSIAALAGGLSSLRVAASRHQASPLQTVQRFSLGTPTRMGCSCLQCSGTSGTTQRAAAANTVVDYTDLIKKSGRKTVDPLLAGVNRWFHTAGASGEVPSDVARKTLTYSFIESADGLNAMDASGFQALSNGQRDRVRAAFDVLSDIIDVSFTEVGSGGDIQYGSNTQASSAGYARYPNEGSQVFMANNQAGFGSDWTEGTYTWQVLLHETGHALGLKHPGNYNAGGGGTPGPYLGAGVDHKSNTIMSYKDAKNMTRVIYADSAFTKTQVHASTFQGFDIQALQYLYGASDDLTAQSYGWQDGQAFSNTLWNPNTGSEVNLANQTGTNIVDLRAGKFSSIGLHDAYADMPFTKAEFAALKSGGKSIASIIGGKPTYTGDKNLYIAEGSQFTRAIGGSGTDSLIGNTIDSHLDGGGGDDNLYWNGGNLTAIGGSGNDTLMLKKVKGATWSVAADGSTATLTRTADSTVTAAVTLSGIESVRYWNGSSLKGTALALYTAAAAPSFSATA